MKFGKRSSLRVRLVPCHVACTLLWAQQLQRHKLWPGLVAALQLARWRSYGESVACDLTILCGCRSRGHGSGFCILNDLAITALELLRRGAVRRVLILDLDVHQVTR